MKNRVRFRGLTVLGSTLLLPCLLHFSLVRESPLEAARTKALADATVLHDKIGQLVTVVQAFQKDQTSRTAVQVAVAETRLAYKRVEYLLDYYYPVAVKGGLNGAPLYHLDPYTPRPVIHAPNGLQRLDELIFSESGPNEEKELLTLATQLRSAYRTIYLDFKKHPLQERELFEAARLQLIRIFTLGVTGFDTPGSTRGLPESAEALQVLQEIFAPYYLTLSSKDQKIGKNLATLFQGGVAYLERYRDFETFDRLEFLVSFVDPLYAGLLDLHLALHLETIGEVTPLEQSWNYRSRSLFAEDFLNPYYYSGLERHSKDEVRRALGKRLFYDPRLSKGQKLSCSTCHHPDKAFTDGQARSLASDGKTHVSRNAPSLVNSVYAKRFFWDMRAFRFEDQMEHVIISHQEFNTNYQHIFNTLNHTPEYRDLFREAFPELPGPSRINKSTLSTALSTYLMSLTAWDSPVDRYIREAATLSPKVKDGFNLFMGKAACGTCHFAPTFAGLVPPFYQESESEVLGVLQDPGSDLPLLDTDRGRIDNRHPKEQVWFYAHSFKTVTVRNVSLTAPYFHNGAYTTLEEVVDFYNHGGGAGAGLALTNQTLAPDSLHLSDYEKEALVEFMQSLEQTSQFSSLPSPLPNKPTKNPY